MCRVVIRWLFKPLRLRTRQSKSVQLERPNIRGRWLVAARRAKGEIITTGEDLKFPCCLMLEKWHNSMESIWRFFQPQLLLSSLQATNHLKEALQAKHSDTQQSQRLVRSSSFCFLQREPSRLPNTQLVPRALHALQESSTRTSGLWWVISYWSRSSKVLMGKIIQSFSLIVETTVITIFKPFYAACLQVLCFSFLKFSI